MLSKEKIKQIRKNINRFNLFLCVTNGGKMSKYSIDDEVTKKVVALSDDNEKKKNLENVLNNIENFQSNFEPSTLSTDKDGVKLEKLKNVEIDDEKIKTQAENELSSYKKESIDKINSEIENKSNELVENKASLEDSYNTSIKSLNNYYDNIKEEASNDALKRGLSRSSIVVNKLDAFNQEQLDNFNKLNSELNSSINEINFELNSLESQKQTALNDFDIEYAYKLNEKINELTSELIDKQEEIIKYNNEIAQTEADYEIKYANLAKTLASENSSKIKNILSLYDEYGEGVIENYKVNESKKMLTDYFDGLSSDEIKNVLLENETKLKNLLGEKTYSSLLNEYVGE